MNARQVLNKLINELPSEFHIGVCSDETRYTTGSKISLKGIYIGAYDKGHTHNASSSKWIEEPTWAKALEVYEKLAKELGWK